MKPINITFEDYELSQQESKELLVTIIDSRINQHKIEYLSNWEKDHTISSEPTDERMDALESVKNELTKAIEENDSDEFDFTISVMVKPKRKKEMAKRILEYSENHN
ncbi:MAG: hypothetical protein KDC79_02370 [Cyclobacteriaceae bacterium]|nr:hypothetical protein [Cyclobacteriaceae bacterium]